MEKLERIVKFEAAYDKRHPDPAKNYGIHGVTLRMILKGENGAVQFVLYTNWQLPHVRKEQLSKGMNADNVELLWSPMPADLGYHSKVPLYDGQTRIKNVCEFTDDGPCYYDGSALNAEPIYELLVNSGSDAVWKKLEDFYIETFQPAEKVE